MDEVLRAADDNMVRVWREIAAQSPVPGAVDDGAITLLSTGVPATLFNPAFVLGTVDDPAAVIDRIRSHYDSLQSPFVLYFRDARTPGLADACAAAGMVEHWQPPIMVLDPIPEVQGPGEPAPDGTAIAPILADELEDYARVVADGFGMPLQLAALIAHEGLLAVDGFDLVLARAGGVPVSTSAVFVTDATAGVYSVATPADHRGRGYGAAVTWAAVRAGAARGATHAILQASEQGEPVYRRMGFVVGDRYRQFEPPSP